MRAASAVDESSCAINLETLPD